MRGASASTMSRPPGVQTDTLQPIIPTPFVWRDPASIPPRPWVLGRWLLRNTITAVVAPIALANHRSWLRCCYRLQRASRC